MQILSFWFLVIINLVLFFFLIKKPSTLLIFSGLIFNYLWRFTNVFYLATSSVPVHSEQMGRDIFGMAPSISYFTINALYLFIIISCWSNLSTRLVNSHNEYNTRLDERIYSCFNTCIFFGLSFVVLYAFFELFINDVIPIRDCLERTIFNSTYHGLFHSFIIEHASMYSFVMGCLAFYPCFKEKKIVQNRYLFLSSLFIVYGLITSNRFSFFLKLFLAFFAPMAIAIIYSKKDSFFKIIRETYVVKTVALYSLIVGGTIIVGLGNSYFRVRGICEINNKNFQAKLADKKNEIFQVDTTGKLEINNLNKVENKLSARLLVQQGEMWWPVYERLDSPHDIKGALHFMFVEPFTKERNTGIQFLMYKTLGSDRARAVVVDHGQTYIVNQFDVIVETFGLYIGTFLILVSGVLFVGVLYLLMHSYFQGHFLSVMSGVYVLYGLQLLSFSGMINFFQPWTFWIKTGTFLFFLKFEKIIYKHESVQRGFDLFSNVQNKLMKSFGRKFF
ncbi:hypothetical protein DOM21_17610 [Bacteriovorax stolpii]|uniref:DUF6418 domain-containing protein n=1 Tax=Bacteriovorax stolpii TaxID=960 RepID=UPI00115ABC92|nr:DUF6418 domain-containing protein [Bacteriovorax stolpii]QDK43240.1 hypothetical protein DOM21_17610 [Bacteriovorax stolpii]